MYNDNPTLPSISKEIDEKQQGKVFYDSPEVKEDGKKFYIESYGCQMNFSDSEIVASILGEAGSILALFVSVQKIRCVRG